MQVTNRAIWMIERNFARPLTLAEIAAACDVSPFHLAHAFADTTGQSVMSYVRGRRLSAAATALADGATDILELALASGYGSHEAFSRAFKALFGATPEAVRKAGSTAALPLVPALDMLEEAPADVASARLEEPGPMSFIGALGHYNFAAIEGIPAQWQRFMTRYAEITDKAAGIPVGVSIGFDGEGEFDYLSAAQVLPVSAAPANMIRVEVPARRYAVFQHRTHVATIRSTYAAIWNFWLPASGWTALDAPMLERHNLGFDTGTGLGGIELWIPITT
jgi:AraC family transcriptional regulator